MAGSAKYMDGPQSITLGNRAVTVASYATLINGKLKAYEERQEEKDTDDVQFLVDKGKGKYKVEDINQKLAKFFCENYPVNQKSDKARRKKLIKGLEHQSTIAKLKHNCSIQ